MSDLRTSIARQEQMKSRLRLLPSPKRMPRKTITKADLNTAVNTALDELDREFRRLGVEFPAHRKAYDTARSVVQNAKRKP